MRGLQPAKELFFLVKAMLRDAWVMKLLEAQVGKDAVIKHVRETERQIKACSTTSSRPPLRRSSTPRKRGSKAGEAGACTVRTGLKNHSAEGTAGGVY
jgi:hypothetical protein